MSGPVQLSEDRRRAGLEAAWELAALGRHVAAMPTHDPEDERVAVDAELVLRCIASRIETLGTVLGSVLDGEDDTDAALLRRVLVVV